MKIREIICKSIINKSKLPEVNYALNPYVGCQHSCRYCYASFMRRFTDHANDAWGSFVDVKINAAEVLAQQLQRKYAGILLLGSVTDCYMPLEEQYHITRNCLQLIAEKKQGDLHVSVLTKSRLVTRDIALLASIKAEVGLTITSHDSQVAKVFEPGCSSPHERIDALGELHNAGIATYIFIGPILPGLTNYDEILSLVSGKTDNVMGEILNFRGCASVMERLVSTKFPESIKEWKFARSCPEEYTNIQRKLLMEKCMKYKLNLIGFYTH
jgi:DNA repair photolyase